MIKARAPFGLDHSRVLALQAQPNAKPLVFDFLIMLRHRSRVIWSGVDSEADCNRAESRWAEYHLCAWRNHWSIQVGLASEEIPTGDGQVGPLQPPLLSSKYKFDSWDSRSKLVPFQPSCAAGASATEIGATFRSGCLTCGESQWIQTSTGELRDFSTAQKAGDLPTAGPVLTSIVRG